MTTKYSLLKDGVDTGQIVQAGRVQTLTYLDSEGNTVEQKFPRTHPWHTGLQCPPMEAAGYSLSEPVVEPKAPQTAEAVRGHAGVIIENGFPAYKQRNAMALMLAGIRDYDRNPNAWPAPLKAQYERDNALWAWTQAVRDRSNEIEAMDPIPQDFTDPSYWPSKPV